MRFQRRAQRIQIDGKKAGAAKRRDDFFDLHRRDALKLPAHFDLADRPIERDHQAPHHHADADHQREHAERRDASRLRQRVIMARSQAKQLDCLRLRPCVDCACACPS